MGIYDRPYYGDSGMGGRRMFAVPRGWSVTTILIAANIAVFFLQVFLTPPRTQGGRDPLMAYGEFSTYRVLWQGGLEFWRFLTFQFLHGSVMHIAFNMFGLYMFGPIVEEQLGRKKYLAFYLVCGVFGALMFLALNLAGTVAQSYGLRMVPGLLFHDQRTGLVGASAGIFGVIMACAYIRPDEKMMLMLPPIAVPMKWLAYGYLAISLASLIFGNDNKGGEAAHVGGALAGFFFVRNSHLLRDFFDLMDDSREPKGRGGKVGAKAKRFKAPKHLKLVNGMDDARPASGPGARAGAVDEKDAEMDAILAKISRVGRGNLTLAEIETLEAATKRRRERDGS